MKTVTLYRPIGIGEWKLIMESGYRRFPPRLHWQPIFYPVLNRPYAEEIAGAWNTQDEFAGYCGIVTAFEVNAGYIEKYAVQTVGDERHQEIWVPAEELEQFNDHIAGKIRIVNVLFGDSFNNPALKQTLLNLLPNT